MVVRLRAPLRLPGVPASARRVLDGHGSGEPIPRRARAARDDKEGTRLLNKFSVPRKPTKNDPRFWITPDDDPVDGEKLYSYCDTDVAAERWASASMPPMTPAEREFWLEDQAINLRGIHIDRKGVRDCIAVLNEALDQY
jgi:DNA polymerase